VITKENSNFILVCASVGVVIFHLQSSFFYIGNFLNIEDVLKFYINNGAYKLVVELIRGFVAIVGVFFINSGYGLSKNGDEPINIFYKKRFFKIILYQ